MSLLGLLRATGMVALVSLVLSAQAVSYSTYDSLNGIASWLAQRKVEVRCLTVKESENDVVIAGWGAEAYVNGWEDPLGHWHPSSAAVFAHGHCERLFAVMRGDTQGHELRDVALSILVLVHESGHLRGHRWSADEAKTQCWAMRHFRYTAQRLGVVDQGALKLLVGSALEIHRGLHADYQLSSCVLPKP